MQFSLAWSTEILLSQLHGYAGKAIHVKDVEIQDITDIKIVSSGDTFDIFPRTFFTNLFQITSSHPLSYDTMDSEAHRELYLMEFKGEKKKKTHQRPEQKKMVSYIINSAIGNSMMMRAI